MNRWIIPFATAAAVFSLWYYPDESRYASHSREATAEGAALVGASDAVRVMRPRKVFSAPAAVIRLASAPAEEIPFDPAEAARRWNGIEEILRCAKQGEGCDLPDGDSRARHFALRDALVGQVRWFQTQRPRTAAEEARSREAAARLLAFPDEAVQAAAMEWVLTLPPKASTLRTLKNNLDLMVDPELARLAVLEARRHVGGEGEAAALEFVGNLVKHGGIFASREAARLAPSLRTSANEEVIRGWLAELPAGGAKARLLREGLASTRTGI